MPYSPWALKPLPKCQPCPNVNLAPLTQGVITFERIQQAAAAGGMAHRGVPVVCKPQRPAFELALRLAGGATAARAVFFDDSTRNVAGGGGLGMMTVLVGRTGVGSGADAEVRSLHDVPTLLPDLWCQLTTPPRRRLGHPPGRVGGTAAAAENGGGPPQQQQQQLGEEQQQASAALAVPS